MGWPKRWLQTTLSAVSIGGIARSNVVDLSSFPWTLSNPELNISVPAKIPSQVHLDLFKAKVIGDPYYGLNDFNLRWVAWANWTYSTTIQADKKAFSNWLVFDGLDTFAEAELCGRHFASTNNQFRQYYFDVTQIVRACENELTLDIHFGSAAAIAKTIAELPNQETWPDGVEGVFEFRHRQFVRKEQNDFGWDWGPAFVPSGIWQPARLVQLEEKQFHIRNTLVDVYRQGQLPLLPPDRSNPWVINASIDAVGQIWPNSAISFELYDQDGKKVIQKGQFVNITQNGHTITGSTIIPADSVELWWPVGFGSQQLYNLSLHVTDEGGKVVASVTKRLGFRTIILNQEPIRADQKAKGVAPGSNWHFEVNGNEFYAKGSNLIPPDAFWTRVTEKKMRRLFNSVVVGNQNMLRVWSSGAYLPDYMYDLADEMGILLWSEFEFGDAAYPANPEFVQNVREEAQYQVRRINHHPSLALWAGGNEMENLVLPTARSGAPEKFDQYLEEYEKVFLDTLGTAVFENSRSISYTPSSTSNGWLHLNFSKSQPITQRYWNTTADEIYGDTDYYNYDYTAAFDYTRYPVGRFSNEFGFHSMPSSQSWLQAVDPADLDFNSPIVRLRNHHYPAGGLDTSNFGPTDMGMGEMINAARMYYPVPNKTDSMANFTSWCHVTQIFQADYYASQIQFYRRGSGMPERQLGSLYWQLEDQWQAPTWAGIEYDGRWKVLHYIAKDRYSNVIISPFFDVETSQLEVYVTSDLWESVSGNTSFTWYDWSGKKLNVSTPPSISFDVGAINTTRVLHINTTEVLGNFDLNNTVLYMESLVRGHLPNSKSSQDFRHQNWFQPVPLSQMKLIDPGLKAAYNSDAQKIRIEATKGIAAWVWLDYPAGVLVHFERNGFWLRSGEVVEVGYTVFPETDTTNGTWVQNVTVESIWDLKIS